MAFLGAFGILIGLAATILFIPILNEYFRCGIVPKFPTLIMISGMYVVMLLLWIGGVILEILEKRHRQLFELYLNLLAEKDRR